VGVGLYGMVGYLGIAFKLGFLVEMDCTTMGKMNVGAVLMGGDKVEVKPTNLFKRKREGEEDT